MTDFHPQVAPPTVEHHVVQHGKAKDYMTLFLYYSSLIQDSRRFKEFVEAAGDEQMQSMVLEGGVKGWVKSGPQFTRLMDGYKETYWQNLFVQEEENEAKKTVTAQGNSSSEQGDKNIAVGQGDVTQ
jgi:hypothetical protein